MDVITLPKMPSGPKSVTRAKMKNMEYNQNHQKCLLRDMFFDFRAMLRSHITPITNGPTKAVTKTIPLNKATNELDEVKVDT